MSAIVQVRALRKTFQRRVRGPGLAGLFRSYVSPASQTYEAVRGLDFDVEEGASLALIGPNGAGKSTTIKLLTGILHPTSGEAHVLGLVPWQQRARLAMNIATVFGQRSQLWYDLPAAESFELLAHIYELPRADYRAHRAALIERFQLGPWLGTPVRKLSLGQRMRCEIAASLLHRPRVLFLDEPTIGLDVLAKAEIRALIRELNRDEGVTVLLTSHDAGDIEQLCQRALLINHGVTVCDERVSVLGSRYLRHKVIAIRLERPCHVSSELRAHAGVRVLDEQPLQLKLEIDTERHAIGPLLASLVGQLAIADIRTEDPSLEQIIGHLYQELGPAREGRSA